MIIRAGVAKGEAANLADRWELWKICKLDDFVTEGESRSSFLLRLTITHPGETPRADRTKDTLAKLRERVLDLHLVVSIQAALQPLKLAQLPLRS